MKMAYYIRLLFCFHVLMDCFCLLPSIVCISFCSKADSLVCWSVPSSFLPLFCLFISFSVSQCAPLKAASMLPDWVLSDRSDGSNICGYGTRGKKYWNYFVDCLSSKLPKKGLLHRFIWLNIFSIIFSIYVRWMGRNKDQLTSMLHHFPFSSTLNVARQCDAWWFVNGIATVVALSPTSWALGKPTAC